MALGARSNPCFPFVPSSFRKRHGSFTEPESRRYHSPSRFVVFASRFRAYGPRRSVFAEGSDPPPRRRDATTARASRRNSLADVWSHEPPARFVPTQSECL